MRKYMTRSQYERHCQTVKNTELKLDAARKKVGEAAKHGDLSENAEYEAAVEESGFLSGRVEELKSMLIGVDIVEPRNTAPGMVTIGKTVLVRNLDTQVERLHHIVGNGTLNTEAGEVSYMAPFGAGLIGTGVGDQPTITLPNGQGRFEILSIDFTDVDDDVND